MRRPAGRAGTERFRGLLFFVTGLWDNGGEMRKKDLKIEQTFV